jgi:hypothetical protein
MVDQADGLRGRAGGVRILSVAGLPAQTASADVAKGLMGAWVGLGASPLLIDGTGKSARSLLGCHPLHEWSPESVMPSFEHSILSHEGRAVIVARGCQAGDSRTTQEATRLGYREIVFDAGELEAGNAPIDPNTSQDLLFLATPDHREVIFALLKGLDQMRSPSRVWLLWNENWDEARRLTQACNQHLKRAPGFIDAPVMSRRGHAFERDCLRMSFQGDDFLEIVTKITLEKSVGGEETPSITKRHA